jgi:hypothetical protein
MLANSTEDYSPVLTLPLISSDPSFFLTLLALDQEAAYY